MFKINRTLLAMMFFIANTMHGFCNEQQSIPAHILTHQEPTGDEPVKEPREVLEEEITPIPLPALLDKPKKKNPEKSYTALSLFLFNIAIFTAGMAIVKAIDGENAP
jgi:hypothetical protein